MTIFDMFLIGSSGVTKGPAVRWGVTLGGRQIFVWMWDNFEKLT